LSSTPATTFARKLNKNLPFVIYAQPIAASDRYFERLQQEAQEALDQGLVLVERQEVFLLGQYRSAAIKKFVGSVPHQPLLEGETKPGGTTNAG
jgi:hypothetical protein